MNIVSLIGVLKQNIDEVYREIEYALPCYNENDVDSQILVSKYWPNSQNSRFTQLATGTKVAITGHLDKNEKFGTILVVEQFDVLK